MRIAARKRSPGSVLVATGRFHTNKAASTPTNVTAFTKNGTATPNAAMRKPPSAGPIAREMLMPRLLSAIAGCSVGRGTSSGTIACQAGAVIAAPTPATNVNTSSTSGVTRSSCVSTPSSAVVTRSPLCVTSSSLRRSTRSASAPAGSANRKTGSVVAAWTSATMAGEGASDVISQPAATSCIQVPMLETTVAVHSIAKTP